MTRILLLCLLSLLSSPGLLLAREVFFYHNDNVGTPVAMTDSSGKVVWRAHDKPFGEEFQTTEAPEHNSRRFIGKEKDKETGLVYIGARYLDPASGRFLQPDPVGPVDPMTGKVNVEMLMNPQRLNRYVYGLNNPYRYIDPDGRMSRDIKKGINPFGMTEGWAPRGGGGISSGSSGARGAVAPKGGGRLPGPTVDPRTGQQVGRFIGDAKGNVMIEPVGGSTVKAGPTLKGGVRPDTHTTYSNGSTYQRLNPSGHANNPTSHAHGHAQGTGPGMRNQGSSLDVHGNPVPSNSPAAHWPAY